MRQQEAALEIRSRENQQRHQSLIGHAGHIDMANVFKTPLEYPTGRIPVVQTTGQAMPNPVVSGQAGSPVIQTGGVIGNTGAMLPPVPRFHTPAGHYHNPADNLYAATVALDRIPLGDSPTAIETRQAIEMLRTAVAQQAQYPHRISALHSTIIAVTLEVIMASLQDLPGYKLRNHRHWRVNRIKHHDNNLDKLIQQYQGHKQLWIAPGQGEQQMGNPLIRFKRIYNF